MKKGLKTCKPLKMWIDGRCFEIRKFDKRAKSLNQSNNCQPRKYEINQNPDGKLSTSFQLPDIYYSQLSKFHNSDLEILQNATKTVICVPNQGSLSITGETEADITEARDEIQSIIGSIRNSVRPRQFISIPIKSDEILENFNKFKNEILSGDKISGMDESIFISPLKLHLTVVVCALLDGRETSEATKALQDYKNLILDPLMQKTGPIRIRVEGIECMNSNHRKVDVLYAKAKFVEESEEISLQKLMNGISEHFNERGLVKSYTDDVKVHMTVINTKYRKDSGTPKKKRWGKKESFDATSIIEKYREFYFGECSLDSIHLSLMSSVDDTGFYKAVSMISTK